MCQMKPAPFDHVAPETLDQALALLVEHGDDAKVLAGGQSLVPVLALRLAAPAWLIDLNRIASLYGIRRLDSGELAIGALTRQRTVERSDTISEANPLLAAAMPWIAHVQIRNRGTIGGSLAHADPAAELPAICVACDATLVAQSRSGRREIAAADFFRGMFETALAADELLTEIRFPAWPAGRTHGFLEVARRHGDFAICGIAATVDRGAAGRIGDIRIVAFGVTDRPIRLAAAEQALTGTTGGSDAIHAAAAAAAVGLSPRSDHHASSEYRLELAQVLTRRTLTQALQNKTA
jgi:carbon-monoxide dehydrogenase medium subunit